MRFFRRIAVFLRLRHEEGHNTNTNNNNYNNNGNNNNNNGDDNEDINNDNNDSDPNHQNPVNVDPVPGPRKGFSVPVQVTVDRPAVGPVLVPCIGDGGVQGLGWYAERTKVDEDGDVGDEFMEELLPDMLSMNQDEEKPFPRFQVNHNVRHAKVKHQAISDDGKFNQCLEIQGKLQWV